MPSLWYFENMVNGNHIQSIRLDRDRLHLVLPDQEITIDIQDCRLGWRTYVAEHMEKEVPETSTCIALTHAINDVPCLEFLDASRTTLNFPKSLWHRNKNWAKWMWVRQELTRWGFTTFNSE